MVDALKLVQQDHVNLDKVLTVLLEVGANLPGNRSDAALSVLSDAIYYIEVFPERIHHPKEEKLLFPHIRKLRPDLAMVIDELTLQHEEGAREIKELANGLKQLESDWSGCRMAFQEQVRKYVEAQRQHMGLEEREILKPMNKEFTSADFRSLNSAYGVTVDPLFGENLATGFDALLKRITR